MWPDLGAQMMSSESLSLSFPLSISHLWFFSILILFSDRLSSCGDEDGPETRLLTSSVSLFSGKKRPSFLVPYWSLNKGGIFLPVTCPILDQWLFWVGIGYSEQLYARPCIFGVRVIWWGCKLFAKGWWDSIIKRREKGMLGRKSQNARPNIHP